MNFKVNSSTILFEDEYLIIVDKPSGLLVHPYKSETNEKNSLMRYVRNYIDHYVYAINRIDRPVSGIVVFSKKRDLVSTIKEIWETEKTKKEYVTLVRRVLREEGEFLFDLSNERGIKQHANTPKRPILQFKHLMSIRF